MHPDQIIHSHIGLGKDSLETVKQQTKLLVNILWSHAGRGVNADAPGKVKSVAHPHRVAEWQRRITTGQIDVRRTALAFAGIWIIVPIYGLESSRLGSLSNSLSLNASTMNNFLSLIAHHGYLLIFLVVLAEAIGLPVPAAVALVAGGAAAAAGTLSVPKVLVIALTAMLLGDSLLFILGRYMGWAPAGPAVPPVGESGVVRSALGRVFLQAR